MFHFPDYLYHKDASERENASPRKLGEENVTIDYDTEQR